MSKKVILFGAGEIGNKAIDFYGKDNISYICDNNMKLHGTTIRDIEVISFEKLLEVHKDSRIIVSVLNVDAIKQITGMLEVNNIPYAFFMDDMDSGESIKEVFTNIYKEKKWGGNEEFYSGYGSHDLDIINPYIELLINLIKNNGIEKICDVGCGDFNIMNNVLKQLQKECVIYDYLGIDVVESLIERNNKLFGSDNCHFMCLDITDPSVELPKKDLLIIRQVLQHLNNESIMGIIKKMKSFKYSLITEHIYDKEVAHYNLDKTTNLYTRVDKMSGVYLEKEPFNCKNIVHLLSVPCEQGIIRTSLIINN